MEVVFTTLAATLCMQFGYFLWKLSAGRQPVIGVAAWHMVALALLRDPRWLGGFALTVVGWVLFLRATGLGEISLVQPLMSTGDVVLVLLAIGFLGERIGRREWWGLGITIAGAFGLALGAQARPGTVNSLLDLTLFVAAALALALALMLTLRGRGRPSGRELPLALAVGLCFGTGAVLTEAWSTLAPAGWQAAVHPLLAGLITANVAGLVLLQAAFQRGRAAVIVPVQLAVGNVVAVAGGGWLFSETLSPLRLASAALVLLGAWLLQPRPA